MSSEVHFEALDEGVLVAGSPGVQCMLSCKHKIELKKNNWTGSDPKDAPVALQYGRRGDNHK